MSRLSAQILHFRGSVIAIPSSTTTPPLTSLAPSSRPTSQSRDGRIGSHFLRRQRRHMPQSHHQQHEQLLTPHHQQTHSLHNPTDRPMALYPTSSLISHHNTRPQPITSQHIHQQHQQRAFSSSMNSPPAPNANQQLEQPLTAPTTTTTTTRPTTLLQTTAAVIRTEIESVQLNLHHRFFSGALSSRPLHRLIGSISRPMSSYNSLAVSIYNSWVKPIYKYGQVRTLVPMEQQLLRTNTLATTEPTSSTVTHRHLLSYGWQSARQAGRFQNKIRSEVNTELKRAFVQPNRSTVVYRRVVDRILRIIGIYPRRPHIGWLFDQYDQTIGQLGIKWTIERATAGKTFFQSMAYITKQLLLRTLPLTIGTILIYYIWFMDNGSKWVQLRNQMVNIWLYLNNQRRIWYLNRLRGTRLNQTVTSLYFEQNSRLKIENFILEKVAGASFDELLLWENISLSQIYDKIDAIENLIRTMESSLDESQDKISLEYVQRRWELSQFRRQNDQKREQTQSAEDKVMQREFERRERDDILRQLRYNSQQSPFASAIPSTPNPTGLFGPVSIPTSSQYAPNYIQDSFSHFISTISPELKNIIATADVQFRSLVATGTAALRKISNPNNTDQNNDNNTTPASLQHQHSKSSRAAHRHELVNSDPILLNYQDYLDSTNLTRYELNRLKTTLQLYRGLLFQLQAQFRLMESVVESDIYQILAKSDHNLVYDAKDGKLQQNQSISFSKLYAETNNNIQNLGQNIKKLLTPTPPSTQPHTAPTVTPTPGHLPTALNPGPATITSEDQTDIEYWRFQALSQWTISAKMLTRLDNLFTTLSHKSTRIKNYYEPENISTILHSIRDMTSQAIKTDTQTHRSLKAMGLITGTSLATTATTATTTTTTTTTTTPPPLVNNDANPTPKSHPDPFLNELLNLPQSHLASMPTFISLHSPPSILGFPSNTSLLMKQNKNLNLLQSTGDVINDELFQLPLLAQSFEHDVLTTMKQMNPYLCSLYTTLYSPLFHIQYEGEEDQLEKSTIQQPPQPLFVSPSLFVSREDLSTLLDVEGEIGELIAPHPNINKNLTIQIELKEPLQAVQESDPAATATTATTISSATIPIVPTRTTAGSNHTSTPLIITLTDDSAGARKGIQSVVQRLYSDRHSQTLFTNLTPANCATRLKKQDTVRSQLERWFKSQKDGV